MLNYGTKYYEMSGTVPFLIIVFLIFYCVTAKCEIINKKTCY